MIVQKFAVNQHTVYQILAWIDAGEIAVPEIQRPFVWDSSQVRDLLDSLYKGYPVGYLIVWQNPNVRLKDGSTSAGKKILIDGQQRVTALMTALRGAQVLDWDYRKRHIAIAFNPMSEVFEVTNPAIQKDVRWIPDISRVFSPHFRILDELNDYCSKNPEADKNQVYTALEKLRGIQNVPIGLIELSHELDIDEVTEIFVRINSKGTKLDQADFAMSKIAVAEKYGGPLLRKAIDYFCHMARHPEFYTQVKESDPEFAASTYFQKMAWLRNDSEDIYDPSYGDMLRVAFTYKFERGRMADLVALLSGRDFETRQYREDVAEKAFATLTEGVLDYMNESNFKKFVMIIKSAGFITGSMIRSSNDLNASYMVFLKLKEKGLPHQQVEALTRAWFVYSALTSRYSGSTESTLDEDIKGIAKDPVCYIRSRIDGELTEEFWSVRLPQDLEVASSANKLYQVFLAAQVKQGDKGFLSQHIKVEDLIKIKGDVHHIFPKDYLKKRGFDRNEYNQVANYVMAESEVNLAVGNKPPSTYLSEVLRQCHTKQPRYGSIVDEDELYENLKAHCIPLDLLDDAGEDYRRFLNERRRLMALKIRDYFNSIYNEVPKCEENTRQPPDILTIIKEKVQNIGRPLEAWNLKMTYGIVTGLDEAFVISEAKKQEILGKCKTDSERRRTEEILKPVLKGRDVRRYYYNQRGEWLIWLCRGSDTEQYPTLLEHLSRYKERLLLRTSGARKRRNPDTVPYRWYELCEAKKSDVLDFDGEKLVWQEIVKGPRFAYAEPGLFCVSSYYMTGENLRYLLGVLNSKPFTFFYWKFYNKGAPTSETLYYYKIHMLKARIPPVTDSNRDIVSRIETLVTRITAIKRSNPNADISEWDKQINQLVYQLYDLTDEEVAFIQEQMKNRESVD